MNASRKNFDFSQMNVQTTESLKSFRRENGFYKALHLIGVVDGKIKDLAEGCTSGCKAANYCCVWIHSPILGLYGQTGSKAGGYGYNREDAAFQSAIGKFDIKFDGYVKPENFLKEFASYLGVDVFDIVESNA